LDASVPGGQLGGNQTLGNGVGGGEQGQVEMMTTIKGKMDGGGELLIHLSLSFIILRHQKLPNHRSLTSFATFWPCPLSTITFVHSLGHVNS
jgi:hypothetical protein